MSVTDDVAAVPAVYRALVDQDHAVADLVAAARSPVHAYLFVGPPGSGMRYAARGFGASLLCPAQGCGQCEVCRRALSGGHPDVVEFERVGASIDADQLREIVRVAQRSPTEGDRKVVVASEFHLVGPRAPMVLKTIEEPPESTVFVLMAEQVTPELVTIASRCVRVDFRPVSRPALLARLLDEGVGADVAELVAAMAGGDIDRARLLAGDDRLAARHEAWRAIPDRIDGTGQTAAACAAELLALIEDAAAPLAARHAEEIATLEARIEQTGERGGGRRQLTDRQRRELRRHRSDELRFGLATLAGRYRDALVAGGALDELAAAIAAVHDAAAALERNPNESLLLQALLLRLPIGELGELGP